VVVVPDYGERYLSSVLFKTLQEEAQHMEAVLV